MECSIQALGENDEALEYTIQWVSPDLSKILISDSDRTLLKTIWLSEENLVIADHVSDTTREERRPALHSVPLIQPAIGYLDPTVLAEQMYGEWKLELYQQHTECRQGIFKVTLPDERAILEVTVDLCTYLPITIRKLLISEDHGEGKVIMSVQFSWNSQLSPESLSPKPIKESQKA
jgi:hypothetical protein